MATVSVKIPEKMKDMIEEQSSEGMYQNDSEYIRDAIREKVKRDNSLTAAEEKELLERIREVRDGEAETVPLEEI